MKQALRSALRHAGYVMASAESLAGRFAESPPGSFFEHLLIAEGGNLNGLHVVQVGANDGRRADPVRRLILRWGWRGVLVEPDPVHFAALQETYAGTSGLQLVNAAVDSERGRRNLYSLAPSLSGIPDWALGLGSFDRARVEAAAADLGLDPRTAVGETPVQTVAWEDVLARLPDGRCDVLVMDTEGYDIPLLRMLDLASVRPRFIHFEHACSPVDDRLQMHAALWAAGYETATAEGDTIAWRCA